jgi:hypothetical protein
MISIGRDGRRIDVSRIIEKCGLLKYKSRQWNLIRLTKLSEVEL